MTRPSGAALTGGVMGVGRQPHQCPSDAGPSRANSGNPKGVPAQLFAMGPPPVRRSPIMAHGLEAPRPTASCLTAPAPRRPGPCPSQTPPPHCRFKETLSTLEDSHLRLGTAIWLQSRAGLSGRHRAEQLARRGVLARRRRRRPTR
jgi:hypothetical protein